MTTPLRAELHDLPERMKHLPIDTRGYPVPWFVAWIDNPDGGPQIPEFRAMDGEKLRRAVREKRCWVCGDKLGARMAFVVGPMCGINRISAEPPSHLECARWSAQYCPFLSKPQMVRREGGPGASPEVIAGAIDNVAGIMLEHNPGATLIWVTRSYKLIREGTGVLFSFGEPEHTEWWALGRHAERAEVEAAVAKGLPHILELAALDGADALAEVARRKAILEGMYP